MEQKNFSFLSFLAKIKAQFSHPKKNFYKVVDGYSNLNPVKNFEFLVLDINKIVNQYDKYISTTTTK
jgi:hypothetical protein